MPSSEALNARRVSRLMHERGAGRASTRSSRARTSCALPIETLDRRALDKLTRGGVHQGVAAEAADDAGLHARGAGRRTADGPPLLVVLDGIEDPQNVGAILRSADAAGADGVVRQARHAAPLDGATAKASAGAVSHVRIATVVNISRALEELKELNVWTVGLDGDGAERYDEVDYTLPTALVLGAEGHGTAPAGPRDVRPASWRSRWRGGVEPERLGRGRRRAVRGGPAAPAPLAHTGGRRASGARRRTARPVQRCRWRRRGAAWGLGDGDVAVLPLWHSACYHSRFVWLA